MQKGIVFHLKINKPDFLPPLKHFGHSVHGEKKIREIDFTEKIFLYVPIHLDCSSVKTLASLLNFTVDFRY